MSTVRKDKIMKFVNKKVAFMEMQQRVIEHAMNRGDDKSVILTLHTNNIALYNYTFDLCQEFGLEMPHVLGVTPKHSSY